MLINLWLFEEINLQAMHRPTHFIKYFGIEWQFVQTLF